MRYRTLGTDGAAISTLCLGTLPFGTRVDAGTSFAILDRFRDAGGTILDTSNNYCCWVPGSAGDDSENLLGAWFASRGTEGTVIASKMGARPSTARGTQWPENCEGLAPGTIRAAALGSLERLGVERIDLYYAHVEDRTVQIGETVAAFDALVKEGLIGAAGVSNHTTSRIKRARAAARAAGSAGYVAAQQRHSLLRPAAGADFAVQEAMDDDLLAYARDEPDLTLFGYSVLHEGAYGRDDRPLPAQYDTPANHRRVAEVRAVAAEIGATPNQVVLAALLSADPPIVPVLGVSSVPQLDECLGALDVALTPAHLARLA